MSGPVVALALILLLLALLVTAVIIHVYAISVTEKDLHSTDSVHQQVKILNGSWQGRHFSRVRNLKWKLRGRRR